MTVSRILPVFTAALLALGAHALAQPRSTPSPRPDAALTHLRAIAPTLAGSASLDGLVVGAAIDALEASPQFDNAAVFDASGRCVALMQEQTAGDVEPASVLLPSRWSDEDRARARRTERTRRPVAARVDLEGTPYYVLAYARR